MYKPEWFKRIQWNKVEIVEQGVMIRELRDKIEKLERRVAAMEEPDMRWDVFAYTDKWRGQRPSALSFRDMQTLISQLLVHLKLEMLHLPGVSCLVKVKKAKKTK